VIEETVLRGCAKRGGGDKHVVIRIDGNEEQVRDGGVWKDKDDEDAGNEQGAVVRLYEDEIFFGTNAG
jgi:hypothetical protein